ncbi:MAG: hypothetical protein LLG24_09680 [Actinomycetia bacterium]|nr:hypothetical protein [Actinomycetes bacterium]
MSDPESGLCYCSQSYCDPVTCQFITKDPARADGEESAYQYCGGDPVGKVDPSGLAFITFRRGRLKVYRFIGRWGGKDHYTLKVDVRAITGKLSLSSSAKDGPIPSGTWYLRGSGWRRNWRAGKGYGPFGGWYNGPLSRVGGGGRSEGFYLHIYDPVTWKWTNTKGCIRVDPWNIGRIRSETLLDLNGTVPIYVTY